MLHRLVASRAKRTIAKNSNETEMFLLSRCRRFNDRDGPSRLLTEPGRRPMATRAVCSPLVAGCQTQNRAVSGVPRDGASNKKPVWTQGLVRMGDGKTNSQLMDVILMVHCNRLMLRRTTTRSPQPAGSTDMAFGEEAMKNHCAYCHGKFGLVRHRRAFKSFCSQTCVDHYRTWLRGEVRKRKSWSDCLWSASLNVVPYSGERSSA